MVRHLYSHQFHLLEITLIYLLRAYNIYLPCTGYLFHARYLGSSVPSGYRSTVHCVPSPDQYTNIYTAHTTYPTEQGTNSIHPKATTLGSRPERRASPIAIREQPPLLTRALRANHQLSLNETSGCTKKSWIV